MVSVFIISVISLLLYTSGLELVSKKDIDQSNVERSAPHRWILDKKGNQTLILQLHGFIFFGTANQLRTRIVKKATAQTVSPLKYIVLDFHKVNEFDSSALNSFERLEGLVLRWPAIRKFLLYHLYVPVIIAFSFRS